MDYNEKVMWIVIAFLVLLTLGSGIAVFTGYGTSKNPAMGT